jgi:hypothetical protein
MPSSAARCDGRLVEAGNGRRTARRTRAAEDDCGKAERTGAQPATGGRRQWMP